MKITAWNNGLKSKTGSGYGFRISAKDRDKYFKKEWSFVIVNLPGINKQIEINIKKNSFWNDTCVELISKEIGKWLQSNKFAPWQKGKPPKFKLENIRKNEFQIII